MTEDYKVIITISLGGEIETTVEGIAGPSCDAATKWLDNLGEVVRHEHTADYHAHVSQQATREHVTAGTGTDDEGGDHGTPW